MQQYLYSPTSISLPNVTSVGQDAFKECDGLTYLDLSSMTRDYVMANYVSWKLYGMMMLKCQGESEAIETNLAGPREDMNYDSNRIITGPNYQWEGGSLDDPYALGVGESAFDIDLHSDSG